MGIVPGVAGEAVEGVAEEEGMEEMGVAEGEVEAEEAGEEEGDTTMAVGVTALISQDLSRCVKC